VKTGKALVAKSRKAQHPQKRETGPVAKPTPKTAEEAHRAIIAAVLDYGTEAVASLALDLLELEASWPEAYKSAVKKVANAGFLLSHLLEGGSSYTKHLAKVVMAYRQQIIRELEVRTAVEYMLLDAAMDAYTHWLEGSAIARMSFKDGTSESVLRVQTRLAGMAQSYLKTYLDTMKTLTDLKQPPIRVLKVQAGQTVAVQVNEQPAGLKVSDPAKGLPYVERRNLLESAPADATPAAADHG